MTLNALGLDVTTAQLRRWLGHLREPHKLDEPALRQLLRLHGQLPTPDTSLEVGKSVVALMTAKIDRLRRGVGMDEEEPLPYRVLRVCFVDGAKLFQAANRLGLSERQLTRERAKAIALLKTELGVVEPFVARAPFRIPLAEHPVSRPREIAKLSSAMNAHSRITVFGAPGVGKSALVAELVSSQRKSRPIFWHQFRPSTNDSLAGLLFELGGHLAGEGAADLEHYIHAATPGIDLTMASRIALGVLARRARLLVLDDWDVVEFDGPINHFIDELTDRVPLVQTITIKRRPTTSVSKDHALEVPSFDRRETALFLKNYGIRLEGSSVDRLHDRTGGNASLLRQAAFLLA